MPQKKIFFLQEFKKRYKQCRKELKKYLDEAPIAPDQAIIQFIAQCDDIDILIDLHSHKSK